MEKKTRLNPFHFIVEHNDAPFARFFRQNFWEKCTDTFQVFFGELTSLTAVRCVGLVDYLCVGLLLGLHQLFCWSYRHSQSDIRATFLLIPLAVLNAVAWLAKTLTSFVLTVLLLPLIALTHQLSEWCGGRQLKQTVLTIQGKDLSTTARAPTKETLSLASFLSLHHHSLSQMEATLTSTQNSLIKQATQHLTTTTRQMASYISLHRPTTPPPSLPTLQLTFTYTHPQKTPWISNTTFCFSSVFLVSMFPCLAAVNAPRLTQATLSRVSTFFNGPDRDSFVALLDLQKGSDRHQLSALFKLNVSNLIEQMKHPDLEPFIRSPLK